MIKQSEDNDYIAYIRQHVGHRIVKFPGALVAIENERGQFLYEKSHKRNLWSFIGGNADTYEDLLHCAIREVKEETHLNVTNLVPFGFYDHPSRARELDNGDIIYSHSMLFYTRDFSGELKIDPSELTHLAWHNPGDIVDEMHETTKLFHTALIEFKKTGCFQYIQTASQHNDWRT